jgi:integrase
MQLDAPRARREQASSRAPSRDPSRRMHGDACAHGLGLATNGRRPSRRDAKLRGGPHTSRRTFASHFLMRVPDPHQLAGILGHSQTRVTELYTHLLPGHLDRARNAVNLSATPKIVADTVAGDP